MTTTSPQPPTDTLSLIDEIEDPSILPPEVIDALEARMSALFQDGLRRPRAEVCVVLVDDDHIRDLNREWRQEDSATDVLSFPLQEGIGAELAGDALGDIVISVPYAARLVASGPPHRARVAQQLLLDPDTLTWTLLDELTFLLIHGALHLLGYDHITEAQEATMKTEEARLMKPFCHPPTP
jgi:ssRNA-specific RNase YbeY (16S rRNA maturation enzyme)